MANPETGLIGILILFVLLMLGTPIGVALGIVGIGGLIITLGLEPALIKAGVTMFETMLRYELGTLPLFLLMAQLCFSANASRDIFEAAARFIGHRRGGLAYAGVGGCAAFSAINGSSLATAATIGMVALPEMRKRGYSDALATGSVAAGGTLGQLIPPSGALIVFGIIAEESIGTLFTAAIIPGITQMLFYFVAIWLVVRFKPHVAPPSPRATWRERWEAALRIVDIFLLILVVIGGIAIGWFTPTEAASVGSAGALAIAAARRKLSKAMLADAFRQTMKTSGMIYLVIIGALVFSAFVSATDFAEFISGVVDMAPGGAMGAIIVMAIVLLLIGTFLDGMGTMLLTTPIFLPIIESHGLSPVWFGIFLVRTMEIGLIHPPVGMNLYVIHGIARDISVMTIFRGVIPFLLADLLHLALLIAFPIIVLWLPNAMGV